MAEQTPSRRTVLKWLAVSLGAPPLLSACAPLWTQTERAPRTGARSLAKVLVAPERVIRHDVGLRPFRRSGFNVGVDIVRIGALTISAALSRARPFSDSGKIALFALLRRCRFFASAASCFSISNAYVAL